MNFYPHNIGDFANETQYLDDEALGIFIRLLDRYMLTEKPIKTQWVSFAFQNSRFEKAKFVLENLFEEVDEGWIYPPMLSTIESYRVNAEKNRENGRKGGRPRKNGNPNVTQTEPKETQPVFSENPNVTQTEPKKSLTNNQEPITNNQINNPLTPLQGETAKPSRSRKPSVEKPDDVSAQTWDDFSALRKAKRAPITATAIDGFRKEAQMAGISLEEALQFSVRQGYQGFKADWYRREERTQNAAPINGAAPKISEDWDSWLR